MTSKRETIIGAVFDALSSVTTLTVERETDAPVTVPSSGMIILRDAAPEILEETLGSVRAWYMQLDLPLELYAPGTTAAIRASRLDAMATSAYTALITDATLGALITHIEPMFLDVMTEAEDGAQSYQAAQFSVRVEYDADNSFG